MSLNVLMNRTASLRICDIFESRNDLLCNYTILQAHSHPSIQASDIFGHAFSTGQMAPVLEQFNIPEEATKAAASGSEKRLNTFLDYCLSFLRSA